MYLSESDHGFTTIYCQSCGESHRITKRCPYRFCPVCSRGRTGRLRSRMDFLLKSYEVPVGCHISHLTLSAPNCIDLRRGVKHLIHAFRRLRNRSFWSKYVIAGFYVIEVTGVDKNFHPHIHAVIITKFIPWKLLFYQWRSVSGGTGCFIKVITRGTAKHYLSKYLSKPSVPMEDLPVVESALSGVRLFTRFGGFAHVDLSILYYRFPCPHCSKTDWLSEYDLKRYEKAFNS